MQKLYRFKSPEETGVWVEDKQLAQKWLKEHLNDIDYDYLDLDDCCYLESLDLYEIDKDTEPEDLVKTEEVWRMVEDKNNPDNPRELGYDFDFFVTWKKEEDDDKGDV